MKNGPEVTFHIFDFCCSQSLFFALDCRGGATISLVLNFLVIIVTGAATEATQFFFHFRVEAKELKLIKISAMAAVFL